MKTFAKAVLMVLPLILVAVAQMVSAPRPSASPAVSPNAVAGIGECPMECFTDEQVVPSDLAQAIGEQGQVAKAR